MKLHHTKSSFRKQCMSDKVFDVVNVTLMVVLAAIFLWPLIFVLSASGCCNIGQGLAFS